MLAGAGYGGIEFERADDPVLVGRDIDDELECERVSPMAAEIVAGLGPAQAGELTGLVRDRLLAYASPNGVVMPGVAWIVAARAV